MSEKLPRVPGYARMSITDRSVQTSPQMARVFVKALLGEGGRAVRVREIPRCWQIGGRCVM